MYIFRRFVRENIFPLLKVSLFSRASNFFCFLYIFAHKLHKLPHVQLLDLISSVFSYKIKAFKLLKLAVVSSWALTPTSLICGHFREGSRGDPLGLWLVFLAKLQLPKPTPLHSLKHTLTYTALPPLLLAIINSLHRSSRSCVCVPETEGKKEIVNIWTEGS